MHAIDVVMEMRTATTPEAEAFIVNTCAHGFARRGVDDQIYLAGKSHEATLFTLAEATEIADRLAGKGEAAVWVYQAPDLTASVYRAYK